MTTTSADQFAAGDQARAVALVLHHCARDATGLQTIIGEAIEAGRAADLLLALLNVIEVIQPDLTDPRMIAALRQLLATLRRAAE